MSRLLCCCCFVGITFLFACSKTVHTPSYPSYYGQWQYIGASFGPGFTTPSPDSVVILTLKSGNTYTVTLNGNSSLEGSFTMDSITYGVTLKFLNITQPYGNNTIATTNGPTFLFFNTAKIGQLTLFEENATSSPGDTLVLTSSPVTPEATNDLFRRIQ